MRTTLVETAARLADAAVRDGMVRGAARAAALIADAVRERLSGGPGGGHEAPWLRTGGLRGSIGVIVAEDGSAVRAVVGSSHIAAVAQELGTVRLAARPYLAPSAAESGEAAARVVGEEVTAALVGGRSLSG